LIRELLQLGPAGLSASAEVSRGAGHDHLAWSFCMLSFGIDRQSWFSSELFDLTSFTTAGSA